MTTAPTTGDAAPDLRTQVLDHLHELRARVGGVMADRVIHEQFRAEVQRTYPGDAPVFLRRYTGLYVPAQAARVAVLASDGEAAGSVWRLVATVRRHKAVASLDLVMASLAADLDSDAVAEARESRYLRFRGDVPPDRFLAALQARLVESVPQPDASEEDVHRALDGIVGVLDEMTDVLTGQRPPVEDDAPVGDWQAIFRPALFPGPLSG